MPSPSPFLTPHWQDELAWAFDVADPWAAEYVEPAFRGDVAAAQSLAYALDNPKRGPMAVAMWRAKIPQPAFRAYLSNVWDHDHAWLIRAAGTRRRLAALFRYAAFELPAFLPDTVPVWRGTAGVPVSKARRGYAWTIHRDIACWFAARMPVEGVVPLVLRADVPRAAIALYHDERNESEAVLIQPPAVVRVDGSPDEWRAGFDRVRNGVRFTS